MNLKQLQRCRLLRDMAAAELFALAASARVRRVEDGDSFFRQGDPSTDLYLLIQGHVKMIYQDRKGHQVILGLAAPGDAFAFVATLGGARHPVSAQAVGGCQALAWDAAVTVPELFSHRATALNACRLIAENVLESWGRLTEAMTERVDQRVARALLRLRTSGGSDEMSTITLSHEDLAAIVGTTPYTISRVLSRWQQQGLVEVGRRKVRLHAPSALAAMDGEA